MNVEQAAAEALLDQGVSVPFKELRIPFTKKVWQPRVTMRRPRLGGQIRIARLYLSLGTTYEQMKAFTKEEDMAFVARHGKALSKMIALTLCRGSITGRLFVSFVAWVIREFVDDVFIQGANLKFVTLMGAKSFSNIIRSVEISNPMTPKLSQKKKGS